jgi:hypothetical protein
MLRALMRALNHMIRVQAAEHYLLRNWHTPPFVILCSRRHAQVVSQRDNPRCLLTLFLPSAATTTVHGVDAMEFSNNFCSKSNDPDEVLIRSKISKSGLRTRHKSVTRSSLGIHTTRKRYHRESITGLTSRDETLGLHTTKIYVAVDATEPLHDDSSAGGPEPSRAAAGSHIKAAAGRARDN